MKHLVKTFWFMNQTGKTEKKYCIALSFDGIYFIFNVKYDHEYDYQPICSSHTTYKLWHNMFNVLEILY